MNPRSFKLLFGFVVGLLVLSLPGLAAAQHATGQLTVAGKATPLAHAYAFAQPGFFDKSTEDVLVLLTDVPLTGKALDDPFERKNLAKQGKLCSVEVVLSAKKQAINVTVLDQAFKMPYSGGSTEDVFEAKVFDGKVAEGRIYRKTPGESFDDIKFTYDITFSAPVVRKGK